MIFKSYPPFIAIINYGLYSLCCTIYCCCCCLVTNSCPTLCDPMDCLPGLSVHGIFQARILEWVAISFSRGSSWPRDRTQVSSIGSRFFIVFCTLHTLPLPCPSLSPLTWLSWRHQRRASLAQALPPAWAPAALMLPTDRLGLFMPSPHFPPTAVILGFSSFL